MTAAKTVMWAVTVEERASEEDGGALLNREHVALCETKAEAEELLDPTDGLLALVAALTGRIRFFVEPVEIDKKRVRRLEVAG